MDIYGEGAAVTLTLPLTIASPASASYTIVDELGAEVVPSTSIAVTGTDTEISLVIAGSVNALADGKVRSLYSVTVEVLDASGNKETLTYRYVVERVVEFAIPTSSFQTYAIALMTAMDIPNVGTFEAADEREQRKALIEAAYRLDQMRYNAYGSGRQDMIEDEFFGVETARLSSLTLLQFQSTHEKFQEALRKAQIVEADDILGGNPIEKQRTAGLMSESVGESSQMYRPGKPVELPVGRRAFAYVADWVVQSKVLGRG